MKLKESTIQELGIILKEEFGVRLRGRKLKDFAYFLVSFYGIMLKFETPPTRSIDKAKGEEQDKGGRKK